MKVTYGGKREKKDPNTVVFENEAVKAKSEEKAKNDVKAKETQGKTVKKKETAKAEATIEETKEANANG